MSDNAAGLDALQDQIDRLRSLGDLQTEIAPELATAFRAHLDAQIARGEAPDGAKWQPTKKGEQPLRNAGKSLTVRALGTAVVAVLSGYVARHHFGYAKGGIRRQILPTRKLPQTFVAAVQEIAGKRFAQHMRGE